VPHDTGLISRESTVLTNLVAERPSEPQSEHACLVVIFGAEIGRRIELTGDELVIGRSRSAELQLDIDNVSRTHASLRRTTRGWMLRDLDSTNGTYVNDEPIRDHALRDGDQIRIGRSMLKFLTSNNVEAQYHEEIYRLMTLDGLTQIYNRRYFEEALEREFTRSRRYGHPFALAIFDLDNFKRINDRHGHLAGDAVLQRVATLVQNHVRTNDLVARIGGEEFALLLPETTRTGGSALAEKLRRIIAGERFRYESHVIPVTVSFGVSEFTPDMERSDTLMKRADERLYEAKNGGRNRVV
jgi:two-component system, cell cycle response regulator